MDYNVRFSHILIFLMGWISLGLGESPSYMILAPNVFHVGVEESISVTISGVSHPVQVQLFLQDYPAKQTNFSHTEGTFQSGVPGFLSINIQYKDVPHHDIESSQYVYLVAMSNHSQQVFRKEVKILLNYKDKMVFVQTDKPIYTPLQTVNIRVMPLDFELKPSKDNVSIVMKNPQDIIVQRWENLTTETGFITKALYLGDHAMIGNWSIIANYGYLKSQNTTSKFEVKEYVLPKFSVRISGPSYILPSTKTINVDLVAKYTYGKPVIGSAIVRLAVTGKGFMDVKVFANTTQLRDGKVRFKVDSNLIKKNALLRSFPTGRRLRVEADVTEKATGVTESVVDRSIYFVNTPYHLSYKNTALYVKPSIPYSIKIDVTYPNKKPASGISIYTRAIGKSKSGREINVMGKDKMNDRAFLQDTTNGDGQVEVSVDVPSDVESIKVEVETKDRSIPAKENAAIEFTAKVYSSKSGSYLHIRPRTTGKGVVGTTSTWDVFQNRNITALNFMVISRGRIVAQATSRPNHGINTVSTMAFFISMEMSPSCRVLAYYITRDNEVVADSAVLDVQPILPNKARLVKQQNKKKHEFQSPRKHEFPGTSLHIKVETTGMSRVALLGVDESIYLLRKKGKLTSKKVFEEVTSLDGSCGAGSGKDNSHVFEKSGMMVITNANVFTKEKGETCVADRSRKRKKRDTLAQEEQACCDNGKFFSRASCVVRVRFMVKATLACREAFLNCCRIAWNEKVPKENIRQRQFQARNGLSADEDDDAGTGQIRKYFPETWIFDEQTAKPDGHVELVATLPDTITSWIIQAISISNETGFGLALPLRITTFKNFFVSLTLPYSVQRGEQLSVIATVFNYGIIEYEYEVKLEGDDGFCSEAMPGVSSKPIKFSLKGNDAKSVTIPIVPVLLGKIQIKVSASQHSIEGFGVITTDTVHRDLLVVPEGAERRLVHSLVLDPQGVLRDEKNSDENNSNSSTTPSPTLKSARAVQAGHQIDNMLLKVPSKAIPGSIRSTLYLTGNLIGPVVTNLIKGGLGDILRMPLGCGEQNMIYLAPNVYVLEYLTNTKQVTSDVEARAYRFIQQGYQQELGFRRKDKSFSAFGETRPGSTWLTAFVLKVFNAATRFDGIAIDKKMMCESVEWLLNNQRADGAFPEVHDLIHKSLLGGVHGDVAMTAFVLTTLLESRCKIQNSPTAIDKAVKYLEQEVNSLTKAHKLALAAYSLALAKSPVGAKANHKLMLLSSYRKDENTRHWDVGGEALNVETAGYALLAQLNLGRLKHGGPIVKWLTEQRNSGGGFISTQDTCVALQALAKYSEKTAGANLDLSVSILPERDATWKRTFHIDNTNALIQKTVDITPFLGGELFIDSLGSGVGQMQIEIAYNVPTSKNETCLFDVIVDVKEVFNEDEGNDMFVLGRSLSRHKRGLRARSKKRRRKCKGKNKNKKRCRKNRRKKTKQGKKNKNKKDKSKKSKKDKKDKKQKTQGRAPDSLLLKICTRYRKPGTTGMTIMDIGIFTGFEADKKSLVELKKNVRPTVDRFEFSDRSIVLYVSEVSSAKEFCAAFKVNRVFGVGAVQPVPIKVYDYYEPADACTKFYSPDAKSELLLAICKDDQCKCTQDGCTHCNIDFPTVNDMLAEACQKHEFVIKARVVLVDEDNEKASWLTYFVEIQQIFKQKNGKAQMTVNEIIEYKKRGECQCPELIEKVEYLIMGQKQGAQLILDKNTVVMPWQGKTIHDNNVLGLFRARMNQNYSCP